MNFLGQIGQKSFRCFKRFAEESKRQRSRKQQSTLWSSYIIPVLCRREATSKDHFVRPSFLIDIGALVLLPAYTAFSTAINDGTGILSTRVVLPAFSYWLMLLLNSMISLSSIYPPSHPKSVPSHPQRCSALQVIFTCFEVFNSIDGLRAIMKKK